MRFYGRVVSALRSPRVGHWLFAVPRGGKNTHGPCGLAVTKEDVAELVFESSPSQACTKRRLISGAFLMPDVDVFFLCLAAEKWDGGLEPWALLLDIQVYFHPGLFLFLPAFGFCLRTSTRFWTTATGKVAWPQEDQLLRGGL